MGRKNKEKRTKYRITQKFVESKVRAANGRDQLYRDEHEKGFGVRINQNGVVTFFLNYVFQGRERRATLGDPSRRRWPQFSVAEAVQAAKDMRHQMSGEHKSDPVVVRREERAAPTVSELAERYLSDYAVPKKRKNSVRDDRYMIERVIRPKLGQMKIAAVTRRDVERIHSSFSKTPYYANRLLSLMSTMWNLAREWKWAVENPARSGKTGIKKYHEDERKTKLSKAQVRALETALSKYEDQDLANALRLIVFTGSRHTEVLSAKWSDFDLAGTPATWTKPSHANKLKKDVTIPLNQHALSALASITRSKESEYLFPGKAKDSHRVSLRDVWYEILDAAKLPRSLHIHDLRHHFGNTLVSNGATLYEVQQLLGHVRPQTTQRYAIIADETLKQASERFDRAFDGALATTTVQ